MASNMSASTSFSSSVELLIAFQSEMLQAYNSILDIAQKAKKEHDRLQDQEPYQINVIDELHINENAHSRILSKLLQYRDPEGRYIILESLIEFIKGRGSSKELKNISIKSPCVTQEKGRIDLWVRDYSTKTALIFENKIYGAGDRDKQLFRYIEKTRNDRKHRFEDSEIFVFYLTKFGDDPSEQTWGAEKYNFRNRYLALSFRYHILHWLKSIVIPRIPQKDDYLRSAILQYVDFLEGLFDIREINKSLNMNLQKYISDQLGLSSISDPDERYQKIEEAIEDLDELKNALAKMKDQVFKDRTKHYAKKWKSCYRVPSKKFKVYDYDNDEWEKEDILFGVEFECDEKPTHLVIGADDNLFCQVQRDISLRSRKLSRRSLSIFSTINRYLDQEADKYIYRYFGKDFDEVYATFCKLVKAIDKEI
jgi:hypothetical protein